MSTGYWSKVDLRVLDNPPRYLDSSDSCWFMMEYTSHGSYDESYANQVIKNIKITKNDIKKSSGRKYYKDQAVKLFAEQLAAAFQTPVAFAAIPPSECPADPNYDNRIEQVLIEANKINPAIQIFDPISRNVTIQKSHHQGVRSIDRHFNSFQWNGFSSQLPNNELYFIDDVLTTGATYKACQKMIRKYASGVNVWGLFWARCVWK